MGNGVLVIYTGGTIGSVPARADDPASPLVPTEDIEDVLKYLPFYDPDAKRVLVEDQWLRIGALSWPAPIDSSDMGPPQWLEMARNVRDHYDEYDGFVILHGTDTMAYSASALAFIFSGLTKPVILTGSQRPIGRTRSDAIQNLVTSMALAAGNRAGLPVVPEVGVFFRDHLYRGCRTVKLSAASYTAFDSPNLPPLATAGGEIRVDPRFLRLPEAGPLSTADKVEEGMVSLDIFPGMSPALLDRVLGTDGLRGAVLKTYGSGNAPTSPAFLGAVERAVERGVVVVSTTQCVNGPVKMGLYHASEGLRSCGVVPLGDMTSEAALTKLGVLLGGGLSPDEVKESMKRDMRGEMG